MIKFHNLLEDYDDSSIVIRLLQLYPDQNRNEEGYFIALKELRELKPIENTEYMSLVVERDNDEDNKEFYSVYGKKPDDPDDEMTYSLAFTPWDSVLGYEIDDGTLVRWPYVDIVAHILWEITYYGFTQSDHAKLRTRLEDIVEDIENGNQQTHT